MTDYNKSKKELIDELNVLRGRVSKLETMKKGETRQIKALREKEFQRQDAMRLEAISTLAGGMAHDINNLLMGIQGNVSLIYLNLDPGHEHYKRLQNIEKNIKTGAEITRKILGFARGGKYMFRPTVISDILKKTVGSFIRNKNMIKINEVYQKDTWSVNADHSQIEQLLLHLLYNASEAMPHGGDIFIQTQNVTLTRKNVKLSDIEPGRFVKISISDTGKGIDKAIMQRIFEPYFTTKERGMGTGLGLSAVFGITKGHGGMIHVESSKKKGTSFYIYLPALNR
jgi:two-component system cell cycle sensor histidine kinase/response regulator CckA